MSMFLTTSPSAQFAEVPAYQLDGDWATLHANVQIPALQETANGWALQLWACAAGEAPELENGIKVAELVFHPNGTGACHVSGQTPAMPPAGQADRTLVLALVSGTEGHLNTLHDSAVVAESARFEQPRLEGHIDFIPGLHSAALEVAAIVNPRGADNLSGTLALEVWSMDSAYLGGSWIGTPVASLVLGQLHGKSDWLNVNHQVSAALPANPGHLTLMLREWTTSGYVTRDFRELQAPVAEVPATIEEEACAPVAAPAETEATPIPAIATPQAKPTARTKVTTAVPTGSDSSVSVNHATEHQLIAVKGLGVAVARGIIAHRPYVKLDDLCRVKGMGPKLLDKIRGQIKL